MGGMVQPCPSLNTIEQPIIRTLDVDWKSIRRRLDVECMMIRQQWGGRYVVGGEIMLNPPLYIKK
jgi:hypothetical protein